MRYTDNSNTIKVYFKQRQSEYVLDRGKYMYAVAGLLAVYEQPCVFNPLIFDGIDCREKQMLIKGFADDFTARYIDKTTVMTDGEGVLRINEEDVDFLFVEIKTALSQKQQISVADKVVMLAEKGVFVFITVSENISRYSHLFYRIKNTAVNPLRIY